MKMKRILAFIICVVACFSFSACSFTWDEEQEIVSVGVIYSETTNKYYIELTYSDGDKSTFEAGSLDALKGEAGDKGDLGNGIAEIITEQVEDRTKVTIKFTAEDQEDEVFYIPHGDYVSSVDFFDPDDTHSQPYLVLAFKSGKTKEVLFPQAKDGKDGIGIEDIEFTPSEEAGKAGVIKIKLSDGTEKSFTLDAATGIESIEKAENDEKYILIITYTNGDIEQKAFDKPNKWMRGEGRPSDESGKTGDFYFDTYNMVIYEKKTDGWEKIYSFLTDANVHSVTFNAKGGKINTDGMNTAEIRTYSVAHGCYLSSAEGSPSVPVPTRDGYIFKGWYRKASKEYPGEEYVLAPFTDLTPVCENLELFAWWEVIS